MLKKGILLVAAIIAFVALITGVLSVANVANADNNQTGNAAPCATGNEAGRWGPPQRGAGPFGGDMVARVAKILNIDQQKLEDAFKQAGTEIATERENAMFANLVSSGKLTQAQADQYKAWLAAKPAGVPGLGGFDSSKSTDFMDKLLKDGKMTQAQYDAWKAWIAQKPGFELPRPERPSAPANQQAPAK